MDIPSSSPSSSREDVVVVDFVVDSDVISDFPESSESAKLKRKTEKLELNLSSRFDLSLVVVIVKVRLYFWFLFLFPHASKER